MAAASIAAPRLAAALAAPRRPAPLQRPAPARLPALLTTCTTRIVAAASSSGSSGSSGGGYQQPLTNQERKAKRAEAQRLGRQVGARPPHACKARLALSCTAWLHRTRLHAGHAAAEARPGASVLACGSAAQTWAQLFLTGRQSTPCPHCLQLCTVNLGQKGLTPAFIEGFRLALAANELVKVGRAGRVAAGVGQPGCPIHAA